MDVEMVLEEHVVTIVGMAAFVVSDQFKGKTVSKERSMEKPRH